MTLPEALAQTHATAFSLSRPWSADEFAALLNSRGVVLIGDETCFVLARFVGDEGEILTLATHPSAQRQGRASAALRLLETEASSRGVRAIFLEVAEGNVAARALYLAAGFVETGRRPRYYVRPDASPVAAIIMRWNAPESSIQI